MIKVTKIELDGYNDWIPSKVTVIEMEQFTKASCMKALHMEGSHCNKKKNVISVMGEEVGFIFVGPI